jgi:hypothetical protein
MMRVSSTTCHSRCRVALLDLVTPRCGIRAIWLTGGADVLQLFRGVKRGGSATPGLRWTRVPLLAGTSPLDRLHRTTTTP